jgi:hypothetical protein
MREPIEIAAFAEPYALAVGIYIRQGSGLVTNLTFTKVDDGEMHSPSFRLHVSEAQARMDSLWTAGLRPAAGKQSEGVTAAQGRHLEDMRALAFAKLNVATPGTK